MIRQTKFDDQAMMTRLSAAGQLRQTAAPARVMMKLASVPLTRVPIRFLGADVPT